MKKCLAAALCGFLFALGLGLSGMTQPSNVQGFLDVAGDWNPRLGVVMGGAVGIGLLGFGWAARRARPWFGESFDRPTESAINARLIGGAAIFGIGWGLAGYCPGPAVVSLVTLNFAPLAFAVGMVAGMFGGRWLLHRSPRRSVTSSS